MKYYLFLALSLLSLGAPAALLEFEEQDKINASKVNGNFNEVKSLMAAKNYNLNFSTFESGELISREKFEAEFDKVRALGISVDPVGLLMIKSVELNTAFAQMAAGSLTLNDIPSTSNFTFTTLEDTNYSGLVSFTNTTGSNILSVTSAPAHGNVTVLANGNFSYSPEANYNGSDSFSFKMNDGTNNSNISVASVMISPVNDAPILSSLTPFSPTHDQAYSGNLVVNDIDSSGFSFTKTLEPTKGSLIISNSGAFTYTPSSLVPGADSFKVKASDGALDSNEITVSLTLGCGSSFHVEGGLCTSNIRNCSVAHGVGTQAWSSGTTYSACMNLDCDDDYEISSDNLSCQHVWPAGTNGNYTIAAGQTLTLDAGELKDYNNLTVNGTLKINGVNSGDITVIGVKGNLVINGTIDAWGNQESTHTDTRTTPNNDALSYTITQALGGGGGDVNGSTPGRTSPGGTGHGNGGQGGTGWNGGGSGGTNTNNGVAGSGGNGAGAGGLGGQGGHGSPGASTYATTSTGGQGGGGGGGGGGSGMNSSGIYKGGGGGGGGAKGSHGLGVYFSVKGTISGSGYIYANGQGGYNGGAGGACNPGGGYGGGGGGAGAGGSGGRVWLRSYANFPASLNILTNAGSGGSGGAGACRSAMSNTASGGGGNNGTPGGVTYLGKP